MSTILQGGVTITDTPGPDIKELYKEDRPLSPQEQADLDRRVAAWKELTKTQEQGIYKVEIRMGWHRLEGDKLSADPIRPGMITVWKNTSRWDGRGDVKLYQCPGKDLKRNTCSAFIPEFGHGGKFAICPNCGSRWTPEELVGERAFALTYAHWALVLYRYFVLLDCDADFIRKDNSDRGQDIRIATELEKERDRGGEVLRRVREKRAQPDRIVRYGKPALIRDISAGADPLARFLAYLKA